MSRTCGECTLCCYTMESAELDMKVGEWCKMCTNTGCSIHEKRPNVCRRFNCVWLQETQIPDSFRPDRIGVVFERPGRCDVFVGHIVNEGAHETPEVKVFVDKINQSGNSVMLCETDSDKKFYALAGDDTLEIITAKLESSYRDHVEAGVI